MCRILRVLDFEAGHMILVGHGGSGRQSLSRLATFCAGHKLMHAHDAHEYDWARWRHELWAVLETASKENVVFLVTQAHLRFDGMLSDLATIVRGGDVSHLAPDAIRMESAGTTSRPRTANTTSSSINSTLPPATSAKPPPSQNPMFYYAKLMEVLRRCTSATPPSASFRKPHWAKPDSGAGPL